MLFPYLLSETVHISIDFPSIQKTAQHSYRIFGTRIQPLLAKSRTQDS